MDYSAPKRARSSFFLRGFTNFQRNVADVIIKRAKENYEIETRCVYNRGGGGGGRIERVRVVFVQTGPPSAPKGEGSQKGKSTRAGCSRNSDSPVTSAISPAISLVSRHPVAAFSFCSSV